MSSDGSRLILGMTLATGETQFSDALQYVFHIRSQSAYGMTTNAVQSVLLCQFDSTGQASCWLGADGDTGGANQTYVKGDASVVAGISTTGLKVFAGTRNDPFFFNSSGFNAVLAAVRAASPALVAGNAFNPAGCPALPADTATALVTQLTRKEDGSPAADDFRSTILALVAEVDVSLVNGGGPITAVWTSTRRQ
jgi:hypothetical protein